MREWKGVCKFRVFAGFDSCAHYPASASLCIVALITLLFLCLVKEKVTKRKTIFFQRLRRKKRALLCYRSSLINCVALVFCLPLLLFSISIGFAAGQSISFCLSCLRHKKVPSYANLHHCYHLVLPMYLSSKFSIVGLPLALRERKEILQTL